MILIHLHDLSISVELVSMAGTEIPSRLSNALLQALHPKLNIEIAWETADTRVPYEQNWY